MASSGRSTLFAEGTGVSLVYAAGDNDGTTSQRGGSSTGNASQQEPVPLAPGLAESAELHDQAAGPHPQINATADAAIMIPPKKKHIYVWRCCQCACNFVFGIFRCGRRNTKKRSEDFARHILLTRHVDGQAQSSPAKVRIDTWCPGNWVSTHRLMQEPFNMDFSDQDRTCIAYAEGTPVFSVGQIELQWSALALNDRSDPWPRSQLKTYTTIFEVVVTDKWDAILGLPSINEHNLLTVNEPFGLYKAHRPEQRQLTPAETAKAEARARARRAEAERLRLQFTQQSQAQRDASTGVTATDSTSTTATNGQ